MTLERFGLIEIGGEDLQLKKACSSIKYVGAVLTYLIGV